MRRWPPDPDYGAGWVPSGMVGGWAPYGSGRWVDDPFYGWTWIDHAPPGH